MIQENAQQSDTANSMAAAATPGSELAARPAKAPAGWLPILLGLALFAAGLAVARYIVVTVWKLPDGDVLEYYHYAVTFWTRQPLFHALPVEYPPLSIAPFSLTLLPTPNGPATSFFLLMGAIALLGYLWLARVAGNRAAIAYACYLLLGAAATALGRFDLIPALATLGAFLAARRGRFTLAYVLLALGVLLKLYPIFLLPPVLVAHWRSLAPDSDRDIVTTLLRRLRHRTDPSASWRPTAALARIAAGCAVFVALVAGVFALAFALNPAGTLSEFQFAGYRPIQIESTPATILWIGSHLHISATIVKTFQSYNYVGPLGSILTPLATLALVAGCLWVYWRHARGRLTLDRAFLAALCVILVSNKLFSPQYLIWVIPFAALVDGLDAFWLAIALLTTLDFPIFYRLVPEFWMFSFRHKLFDVLMFDLLLRNGLLLYVTLRAILRTGPAPDLLTQLRRVASLTRLGATRSLNPSPAPPR